jgi:hypothetical protein
MELSDFISGERFQGLADVSVIPEGSGIGEKECGFVIDQQRNNNYTAFYYNESTTVLPDYVLNAKSIFVNNWTLSKFFKIIFPLLTNKYIFISHNSDETFNDSYRCYLDNDKVIAWYSQNSITDHPKLYSLPIGLGNQQYPHGNLNLLNSIIKRNVPKDLLVFKNFNIGTNFRERVVVDNITTQNGISMSSPLDQKNYFETIARTAFVINPPGNGPDCHRIWESLYLKAIPVIKYSDCFKQYRELPILFINDWNEVTIPKLQDEVKNFNNINRRIEQLSLSYWKNKIFKY